MQMTPSADSMSVSCNYCVILSMLTLSNLLASNDPIWTTYVDAATNYDETTIRSWNQSMDALLVFV